MSWIALAWAEKTPVADVYERVILMQMAARASDDGTGVWLSQETMAEHSVSDEKTIKRRLDALLERGVIALGDQRLTAHLRADHRPTVYDLMIPARHYGDHLDDVNKESARYGRPPITPATRPALPAVEPSRKRRKDAGVKRPRTSVEEQPLPSGTGGLQVHEVTTSPARGDYKSETGGLVVQDEGTSSHPKQSMTLPVESALEPTARARDEPPVTIEVPPVFPVGVSADHDPDGLEPQVVSRQPEAIKIVNRFEDRTNRLSRSEKAKWWAAVSKLLDIGYSVEVAEAALDRCITDGVGWGLLESKALIVANQARFAAARKPRPSTTSVRFQQQVEDHKAWFNEDGSMRHDLGNTAPQVIEAAPEYPAITG